MRFGREGLVALVCAAILGGIGGGLAFAMRSGEPVTVSPIPTVKGRAIVQPSTDPFAELKRLYPPAAHLLSTLLPCAAERCLFNSQKGPTLTTVSVGALIMAKKQLSLHIEEASDDPELREIMLEVHRSIDKVQNPLYRLDELLKKRASAQMPR